MVCSYFELLQIITIDSMHGYLIWIVLRQNKFAHMETAIIAKTETDRWSSGAPVQEPVSPVFQRCVCDSCLWGSATGGIPKIKPFDQKCARNRW